MNENLEYLQADLDELQCGHTGERHLREALRRLGHPRTAPMPNGLPGELYDRLEMALLTCAPSDPLELRALFIDERINQWRDLLPQASTCIARTREIIAALYAITNAHHENALAVLLYVLRDRNHHNNTCYRKLGLLISDVEKLTNP